MIGTVTPVIQGVGMTLQLNYWGPKERCRPHQSCDVFHSFSALGSCVQDVYTLRG